jgi:hypothetical protein
MSNRLPAVRARNDRWVSTHVFVDESGRAGYLLVAWEFPELT